MRYYLSHILSFISSRCSSYFDAEESNSSTIWSNWKVWWVWNKWTKYEEIKLSNNTRTISRVFPNSSNPGTQPANIVRLLTSWTKWGHDSKWTHWSPHQEGCSSGSKILSKNWIWCWSNARVCHLFLPHLAPSCLHSPWPITLPQPSAQSHSKVPSSVA